MEPTETQKNILESRAKEIDTGAFPLAMSNALLGLPVLNDPGTNDHTGSFTQSWDYAELVSQKKLLTTINITSSTTGVVWSFDNTWNNVLNNHFTGPNMRALFGLRSWTLNFLFEFRSNFQQVGQMVLFYSNLPKVLESYFFPGMDDPFSNYRVMTQLPHRKIAMGEDLDCVVSLTWNSPHTAEFGHDAFGDGGANNFYPKTPYYDMGCLRLAVPFQMNVSSGVDSQMSVRVWTYLSDFKAGAYVPKNYAL